MIMPVRTTMQAILSRMDRERGRDLDGMFSALKIGRFDREGRREMRLALLADAADAWMAENPDFERSATGSVAEAIARGDGETPILDFIRDLIDSGKIQAFLSWLFENLPTLIAAIVAIFA